MGRMELMAKQKREREARKAAKKKKDAKNIQEKIQNKEFKVKKLSTENKELYGSVKPTEIAKIINTIKNIMLTYILVEIVLRILGFKLSNT